MCCLSLMYWEQQYSGGTATRKQQNITTFFGQNADFGTFFGLKCWFWIFVVAEMVVLDLFLLKWWFWKREQEFNRNSVSPPDSVECEKQNLFARFHFSNIINSQWNCRFYVFTKLEKTFRLACSNGCLLCLQCLGDSIQVELKSRMLVLGQNPFSSYFIPSCWVNIVILVSDRMKRHSREKILSQVLLPRIPERPKHLEVVLCGLHLGRALPGGHHHLQAPDHLHGEGVLGERQAEADPKLHPRWELQVKQPASSPQWLLWMSKAILGRYDVLALLPLDLLYLKFGRECTLLRWMSELMVDCTEKHFLLGCRVSPIDGGLYLNSSGCPVSPSSETSWSFSADLVRIRSLLRWL